MQRKAIQKKDFSIRKIKKMAFKPRLSIVEVVVEKYLKCLMISKTGKEQIGMKPRKLPLS